MAKTKAELLKDIEYQDYRIANLQGVADTLKSQNDRLYKIIDCIFKGQTKIASVLWATHQENDIDKLD